MKTIPLCLLLTTSISMSWAIENLNAKKAPQKVIIDSPSAENSRTPKFRGMDVSFLDVILSDDFINRYRKSIEEKNKHHSPKILWENLDWNVEYYNRENLPVVIGELVDKKGFSKFLSQKGLRFLDLPIHMPGQGWRIPTELEQFKEVIAMAVEHERILNPTFENDHYVYITVDQGVVPPKESQRRAGFHGDSYRRIDTKNKQVTVPVDYLYVVYDNCPTRFVKGPFSFQDIDPENSEAVLAKFSSIAEKQKPVLYPNYTLVRMDPYCVHDAGTNETDQSVNRTFVKISVSKVKYAHLGNAKNNLFIYDWPMVPRHGVPYTKEAISESSHRKDRDEFLEIDPSEIDFMKKRSDVKWATNRIHTVYKTAPVKAEPAIEGEILHSRSDGFLITLNVAEKGDYKVTFYAEDQGFMSPERFEALYAPIPHRLGWYQPKKFLRRAVALTKDVRFKAPWGTITYGRKGDYLVYVNENDRHVVPKVNFENSYEILD